MRATQAVILDHGMNENYAQPSLPQGVEADVIRGLYRYGVQAAPQAKGQVRLLGSGAILREVIAAIDYVRACRS